MDTYHQGPGVAWKRLDVSISYKREQTVRRYFQHAPFTAIVVVVDSHIQRTVLTTEETTVTQQVSHHRPIKCQSRLWSQRDTKVNTSQHGDNPLLRPTGIQIATKRYATLQAMTPTNITTVHQTSLLHTESNLDRLIVFAYARPAFSATKRTYYAPTSFDQ